MNKQSAGIMFRALRHRLNRWTEVPPELIGCWQATDSIWEFKDNSTLYLGSLPAPYLISNDGLSFDWNGWIWNRKYGSGPTLVGVWLEPNTGEELTMRMDGPYEWYSPTQDGSPEEYFGRYRGQDSLFRNMEMRGIVTNDGSMMTLDAPYNPTITFPFQITGNELHLHSPDGEIVAVRDVCEPI